jgi:hypothetical protein
VSLHMVGELLLSPWIGEKVTSFPRVDKQKLFYILSYYMILLNTFCL